MLADGTLESWDMLVAKPFQPIEFNAISRSFSVPRQRRTILPQQKSVDVPQAILFLAESLLDNQGYFLSVTGNDNRVKIPFAALEIKTGDIYDNIDTNEEYIVKEVIEDPDTHEPNGEVILSDTNGNAAAPKIWNRIRPRNHIRFMDAFPKTYAEPYKFDPDEESDTNLKRGVGPWTDTITWHTVRKESGGMKKPFTDPRQTKPQKHEFVSTPEHDDSDYWHVIEGQVFDTIVQFDLWAQTNRRAEWLAAWFQDFFERYRWVWKYNGVKEILYWQQNADALVTRWRNDIVSRSVQLYFQTERLSTYPVRRITDITLAVDVLVHGEHVETDTTEIVGTKIRPVAAAPDASGIIDPTGVVTASLIDGAGYLFE
jgi:hypothetical protein